MRHVVAITILLVSIVPVAAYAHPGRTDSSGCHTCRTNCSNWGLSTGEYHCHRAKAVPQPEAPIKSTFGEGGTGYTSPAPEYAVPAAITPATAPKKVEKEPKKPSQKQREKVDAQIKPNASSTPREKKAGEPIPSPVRIPAQTAPITETSSTDFSTFTRLLTAMLRLAF